MKLKHRISGVVCSTLLFAASANAQACYYEGDPVKTASGYDTPKTSSSIACYYDGDPVRNESGKYDSPLISSDSGSYYTADFPEKVTYYGSEQSEEYSAFEHDGDSAADTDNETVARNSEKQWMPTGSSL